jgi:hypothetical protein
MKIMIIITFGWLFKNSIYILISMYIAFGYYDWRERTPLNSKEVLLGKPLLGSNNFWHTQFSSSPTHHPHITTTITTPSLTKPTSPQGF